MSLFNTIKRPCILILLGLLAGSPNILWAFPQHDTRVNPIARADDHPRHLDMQKRRAAMQDLVDRHRAHRLSKKRSMERRANRMGIPLKSAQHQRQGFELRRFLGQRPVFYSEANRTSANSIATNKVWNGGTAGLNLDGSGIGIGVWDKGQVRSTHQELVGRVITNDFAVTTDHATHVAGTIAASGVLPAAKGMASNALIRSFDWNSDTAEMASSQLTSDPIKISNHSYNYITGWFFDQFDDGRWVWSGDVTISTQEDYLFGFYDEGAREWDEVAYGAPNYLIVVSAGNDRNDFAPSPGTVHWEFNGVGYQLSSSGKPNDGGNTGFDTIAGGSANSKNVMTVGAVLDIFSGYVSPNSVQMTPFSGWGPTDDGRIKPDVVANGWTVQSSNANGNFNYDVRSGTSMSAPAVAGSAALLAQHAENLNPGEILAATLKGLILHTTDEAGTDPGPDYIYGWGLMNTERAASVLTQDAQRVNSRTWYELSLSESGYKDLEVVSSGQEPLRVTISWTDPAGVPPNDSLDPGTLMLVNDLDIRVISPDGTVHNPWVLNPSQPSAGATTGDNFRDNVEQVFIPNTVSGVYKILVSHKNTLQGGNQPYSLIVTGHTDQPVPLSAPNIVSSPNLSAGIGTHYRYDDNAYLETLGTGPISYELVEGPDGMQVSATGKVSWLPSVLQGGNHTVSIKASNAQGEDTQVFVVSVSDTPAINFNDFSVDTFDASQDITGTVAIEQGGSALRLTGNLFKKIDYPYTVTEHTILEFEFSSNTQGEIHGIGMDEDLFVNSNRTFQLFGTQTWGIQGYRTYPGVGQVRFYKIRLGDFFTGPMNYLFFAMDHDNGASGESVFSNIRIYEEPPPPQIVSTPNTTARAGQPYLYDSDGKVEANGPGPITYSVVGPAGMTIDADSGLITWTPSASGPAAVEVRAANGGGIDTQQFTINVAEPLPDDIVDFSQVTVDTYDAGQDVTGQVLVEDGGATVRLTGNLFKKINFPYLVTEDTVLEFDYQSSVSGEIHAIGLDDDLSHSVEKTFQLHGSQTWGIQEHRDYPGNGVSKHYKIRVGDFYTGSMLYLFFVMDDDASANGEAVFSNIKVYEDIDTPTGTPPLIISTPSTIATVDQAYVYDADSRVEATGTGPISYSVSGPALMSIDSASGLLTWTPTQTGNFNVEITATNNVGEAIQSFTINVSSPPAGALNFNDYVVGTYDASQDITGTISIENGGSALRLTGNLFKKIDFPYVVTPNTILEFDFSSSAMGEIHGIGLDDDLFVSSGQSFQLYGSQTWGIQNHRTYSGGGSTRHYVIRVGDFFTGPMQYLFFMMDDDLGANGESVFSNIKVYEDAPSLINFNDYSVDTYDSVQDVTGTVFIDNNGLTLRLVGNIFKKIDFPYNVTPDTVIEFDFRSTQEGEVHAIGMDDNLLVNSTQTFQLFGTQTWGIQTYRDYPGNGQSKHYKIRIGEVLTGPMQYLFFAMDDDAAASGESIFSNVTIYEQPQ